MATAAPPQLQIRPAAPTDEAALGRLGAMLVALHHDFDPQRFIPEEPGTARGYGRFLVSQLAEPDALVLVAEADGAVVGYAYAAVEGQDWMALRGPAGVIYDILIDPERRGQRLGSRLLAAVVEALTQRGSPRIVLSAAARNEGAQRLFARFGFRPTMVEMTLDRPG